MEKRYIVLTPEKIEDIFRDLEIEISSHIRGLPFTRDIIKDVIQSKKQELLKQLTK
jgi:hypothetical protein